MRECTHLFAQFVDKLGFRLDLVLQSLHYNAIVARAIAAAGTGGRPFAGGTARTGCCTCWGTRFVGGSSVIRENRFGSHRRHEGFALQISTSSSRRPGLRAGRQRSGHIGELRAQFGVLLGEGDRIGFEGAVFVAHRAQL